MDTPLVGQDLQGLRVVALLGRGGMGEVYKAFDHRLQRTVAIKMVSELCAIDRDFAARFAREARSASAVNHPNVAHVFSSGEFHDRPYYVMEYVEGKSLADLLEESGHLGGRRSLDFLLQAAEGMRAAAAAGIVHRDLKPANIMVDAAGKVKIVDFGLARRLAEDIRVTRSEHVLGTPTYLSPEQAQGQEVDQRSDIYSLGATFYHLLAGAPPFDGDSPVAVMLKHVAEPPPPLRERNPRVPPAVAAIIERMMAKDPRDRYQSYDELIADVEAALGGRSADLQPATQRLAVATVNPVPGGRSWLVPALAGAAIATVLAIVLLRPRTPSPAPTVEDHPERHGVVAPPDDGEPTPQELLQRLADAPGSVDSEMALRMAAHANTLGTLRNLAIACQVEESRSGVLPEDLDALVSSGGFGTRSTRDGWGRAIRYTRLSEHDFRLTSSGADGVFDTADDVEIENGEVTKGGVHGPLPRGLGAAAPTPP